MYFDGGEPFLYYPLLVYGIGEARKLGYRVGVVTNGYWATTPEDVLLWLRPLAEYGIEDFSVSADTLHDGDFAAEKERIFAKACEGLQMNLSFMRTENRCDDNCDSVLYRGRAADRLAQDAPARPAQIYIECGRESLDNPSRVHVDPLGNVFPCQGIVIGNAWEKDLRRIMAEYDPMAHPVIGPLLKGGPFGLAEKYGFELDSNGLNAAVFLSAGAATSAEVS